MRLLSTSSNSHTSNSCSTSGGSLLRVCTAAASLFVSLSVAAASFDATFAAAQRATVYPRATINVMSPHEGSVLGGTRITFVGEWLGDSNADTVVYLGDTEGEHTLCERVGFYSSETRLVCETEAFHLRHDLPVRVVTRGLEATCNDRYGCDYRFTEDSTPEVHESRPEFVAGPAVLTMSGSDFELGDENSENRDFNVKIGDERCPKQDLPFSHNKMQCHATSATRAGAHDISATLSRRGIARVSAGAKSVLVVPTITSVHPSRGSIAGGQSVTVRGSGFQLVASRNTVSIDGAQCVPTSVSHDSIECVTSAHGATAAAAAAAPAVGQVNVDYYRGLAYGDLQELLGSRQYLQPTDTKVVSKFGGLDPFPEASYGGFRYTALFAPPADGTYQFEIKGDDIVELWLSEDANEVPHVKTQQEEDEPFNERRIAFTTRYRGSYDDEDSQQSANVTLFSNQTYWMRVYVKNNGHGSGFDVRVNLPSGESVENPSGALVQLPSASSPTPVSVTSYGISAHCVGTCLSGAAQYSYDTSVTPVVSSVSPTTISAGDSCTISGTGFDANGDNVVTAGGVECTLVSTSETEIICAFGQAPPGTVDLLVRVGTNGLARGSGSITGNIAVSSVSPSTGSISGGTALTLAGSGFGTVASAIEVDINGTACTVTSVSNNQVVCTTAASAAGSATITVTRARGTTTQSAFAVAFDETRPVLDTVPGAARLLTKNVAVSGDVVKIEMPAEKFTSRSDATVALVDSNGNSASCPTQFAFATYVTCLSPYHAPGTVNVTVNGAVVGSLTVREEVTRVDAWRFGPNGGNSARIWIDRFGNSRDVAVSVGGAPCESLRWADSSSVECFAGPRSLDANSLPTVFDALGNPATAASELETLFVHDGASTTTDGVTYLPAGKILATKRHFDRPVVVTARVRPTRSTVGASSSETCVYMRVFPKDVGARDSGLIGYAGRNDRRLGMGQYGTRNWMPNGLTEFEVGTITENIGLDPNSWAEWKMELRPRGARFFINNVEIYNEDGFRGEARGTVGFGHSCQDIAITNVTVKDLSSNVLQVTVDGRSVWTDRDVAITDATSATVSNTMSSNTVYGNEYVSFSAGSRYSTWRLSAYALESANDNRQLDQIPTFCSSFGYVPDTNTLRCRVSSGLAAGTYTVKLRDIYGGFFAQSFTVTVRPTILDVNPSQLPTAGGFVIVSGRNLPENSTANTVAFTLGSQALTIDQFGDGSSIVVRVPAVAEGTHELTGTNSRCAADSEDTCSVTVSDASAPTVTSVLPSAISDIDATITVFGGNFSGRGRIYVGDHLCTVYWASSTQAKCTLRTIPDAGTYTVTSYIGLRLASGTPSIIVTWDSVRLVSSRALGPQGGSVAVFRGIVSHASGTQTNLVSESYGTAGASTSLTGFAPAWETGCGSPIGPFLKSRDQTDFTATSSLSSIGTHGSLTVTFNVALVDTSSSGFTVTVDGTEYYTEGEVTCTSSLCRWSSDECYAPVSITVPHTAATATITVRASSSRYWGLRDFAVASSDASTYSAVVNGTNMTFHSASYKTLRFTVPAVDAAVHYVTVSNSAGAIPCSDCDITFSNTSAPLATAFYQGTHDATGVTWVSTSGIMHTSGAPASLRRTRGRQGHWEHAAYSSELFPQGGITGVTFKFESDSSECRVMFGLSSGADASSSYQELDFAIYNDRGNVEVYEGGSRRFDGGNFAGIATSGAVIGIRCADSACTAIEYTVDGHMIYRSTRTVEFPLRLDSTFHYNGCGVSDINVARGTASTTYPVYIAGNFDADNDRDATVTVNGGNCAVVSVADGMIVCNSDATVSDPATVVISSPARGTGEVQGVPASAIVYGRSAGASSTLGGARRQIKGAGFSSPSFDVCGTVVSSTSDAVVCDTAALAAGDQVVNASGVACAGSCNTISFTADLDATVTSVTSPITVGASVVVEGTIPAGSVLRLADGVECAPTADMIFATNFTCAFASHPAAGTYSAVVAHPGGVSASTSVVVALTVSDVSPAVELGLLGSGTLLIAGSGLSASATVTDANSAALCSSVAMDGADLVCTLNSFGSAPSSPFTVTVGTESATVSGVSFASSANPTITAATPSDVGCGDAVVVTGTNLVSGMTITVGGIACSGVVAATDGNSATCTLSGALEHGSSHAVALSTTAGAGSSSVTLAARLAVCSVSATVTSSGLDVTAVASGVDTSATHKMFVGGSACTISSTTATTVVCSIASPATFSGEYHRVALATATAATATSSDFAFDSASSPTVTGISPVSGGAAGGTEATITGTKFDLDPQQNNVMIGSSRCYAIEVASTQDSLVCITEPHAVDAAASVAVEVVGLGAAASSTTYDYQLSITGASKGEAGGEATSAFSVEGGVPLVLAVTGLPDQQTNVKVSIGYVNAPITSYNTTHVVVTVPAARRDHSATPELQPMQADYTMRASQTGVIRLTASGVEAAVDDSTIAVAYDTTITPNITAVDIAEDALTTPEASLVIDGAGFAASGNEVLLVNQRTGNATQACAITAESATQITCTINATIFGRSRVVVRVPGIGDAFTARTCPSGTFLTCDGQCLTDSDCTVSTWGRSGCDDLVELLYGETFCHSNGGTDRVNRPLRLDGGKEWNLNCPLYNCEGSDCNKTLNYAGRSPRINTCGVDPNGHYLTLVPEITAIAGEKTSSVLGGQRFTLTGRGFNDRAMARVGPVGARVVSATYDTLIVETTPYGAESANQTLLLTIDKTEATCSAAVCGEFYFNLSTTPMVSQVQLNYSHVDQQITVSGTGFASTNEVTVGGSSCAVVAESSSQIVCNSPALPMTSSYTYYSVLVRAVDIGFANMPSGNDGRVRYLPRVKSVSPSSGSTSGGTLVTITGFGFAEENWPVYVWFNWCGVHIESVTPTTIIGRTTGCSGTQSARVRVHGQYSSCVDGGSCTFHFDSAATPAVTSHDISDASAGNAITMSGTFLSSTSSDFTVTVGDANCTNVVANATVVTCDAPSNAVAGTHTVRMRVDNYGFATGLGQITYSMSVSSFTPTSGSLGGGQEITISGAGFPATMWDTLQATVAGQPCAITSTSNSEIVCTTSASTSAATGAVVVVLDESTNATSSATYSYDASLTATVSAISPSRGSTAGGTIITLTGTGLSTSHVVTISGVTCTQTTAQQTATTSTSYPCTTGAHTSELTFSTVVVSKGTDGNAQVAADATYQYVDLWSRRTTWNGYPPPVAGDSVVIPEGQTVMLDYSPPKMILIVVQGHLIFDDTVDITLEAHYIVVHFGRMTIGTESKPYGKRAVIRMFGDRLSPEIPLAGAKTLLVYKGRLDIHGTPRTTWTKLAATAAAGANSIVVRGDVQWNAGEEIVVGPTNFEFLEAEPRFITSTSYNSSADTTTVTFSGALRYMHWGENQCFGTENPVCVDESAEVMLLSRNILFTGDDDSYKNTFGATTMFRPMGQNEERTIRVSYVEFTKVGQKFMLGRYPIHFHIPGDANNSYIEGCSVHRSLQRAITIHGVNNATFRKNVVYDTFGHSIFWEDGSEKYNVAEDNCVFLTRVSTSSLNSDTTPANFWLTNPMNYLRRNVAGGAVFYGFWISPMVPHATGPSGGSHICPQTQSLGAFEDNHAHSNGNYGLQVKPNWFPKRVQCRSSSGDEQATLLRFTSTKNHIHGINFMTIGSIQLDGYTAADIGTTDIESSLVWNEHVAARNQTAGVRNSVFIAYTANQPYHRGSIRRGINMPLSDNYFIHNTTFVNMENENWAFEPFRRQKRMSLNYPWAWEFVTSGLRFINAQQRLRYRFQHHSIANDMDGTLGGFAGHQVVPVTPFFENQAACTRVTGWNTNYPTFTCAPSFKIRRIGMATSAGGGNQNWTIGDVSEIVYRLKGKYLVSVPINSAVLLQWLAAEGPNTYNNYFNTRYMRSHEKLLLTDLRKEHRQSINASFNDREPTMLSGEPTLDFNNSAYYYNYTENAVHALWHMPHSKLTLRAYRCPPEGCLTPGGPPPVNKSCEPFGVAESWASGVVPTYDVNITYEDSICVDQSISTWPDVFIGGLTVGGRLEFRDEFCPTNGSTVRIHIARWIHVKNGIIAIGNATHPVTSCRVEIIMGAVNLNNLTDVRHKSLLVWGTRSFAVEYGRVDIFGRLPATPVAHLSATADVGATTLQLDRAVDWAVGDTIAIAQTTRNTMFLEGSDRTEETERVNITGISANRRSVNISVPLEFEHMGDVPKSLNSTMYNIGAEVALLNRNVVIHGGHWDGEPIHYDHGWQLNIGCTPQNYEGCAGGSVDRNGYPMSVLRPGVIHIDGVEMRDVGVKSKRHAGVEIDGLRGNRVDENFISNCVVHRSFAVSISLRDASEPMRLEGNVVYDTQGDGIRVASTNNQLVGNLVMVGRVPTGFCGSIYVPKKPDCWPALYRVTAHNTLINNTAASGVAIGYKTEGTPCSDTTNMWRGNKVHAVRDAMLVMDNPAVADYRWPSVSFAGTDGCRRIEGVVAYSNADHGVALWFPRGDNYHVQHMVSVDNPVGFAASVSSASVDRGQSEMSMVLEHSTYAGKWPGHGCRRSVYRCRKTKVDSGPWCRSFQDKAPRMGNIGIFETVFMSSVTGKTLGEHYFIWHEPYGYAVIKAKAQYRNLFFDEWDGDNECGTKTVAVYQNPFSNDTHHQHTFSNIQYGSSVVNGGEMWAKTTYGPIPGHMTHGLPPQQTYYMDYDNQRFGAFWPDAPNKIWMVDEDGSLTRSSGRVDVLSSQSLTRNSTWASMGGFNGVENVTQIGAVRDECSYHSQWNMFKCDSQRVKWLNLIVESTADDAWTRRVGPLVLCKGYGMTRANGDPICEEGIVDFVGGPISKSLGHRALQLRMSRFRFIIENGANYTLHYRGSPPASTRFHLTNWEHTGLSESEVGVVINTRIYGAFSHSRLAVYVDGRKERPTFGFGFPHEFGMSWPGPLDRAGTHYHDKYVTPFLHRNVMSFSMRPSVVMDLRHEMIIQINMDLAIPMSEFFNRRDTFALALANALGVDASTVRFVKVVPGTSRRQDTGTTSIEMEVDGGDNELNTTTAAAIQSRVETVSSDTTALSQTLNVTVLTVESAIVVVRDPEPAVSIEIGKAYMKFHVTHDSSVVTDGFDTTAVQAQFIAQVQAALTNATVAAATDDTTLLIGNAYTIPDTSMTRFTVVFAFVEPEYDAVAMSALNSTVNAMPASLFPAGYAYVNHTYFASAEAVALTTTTTTTTTAASPVATNTTTTTTTTTTPAPGVTPTPPVVPAPTPQATTVQEAEDVSDSMSTGVLVAIIVVPIVVIAAISAAVFLYMRTATNAMVKSSAAAPPEAEVVRPKTPADAEVPSDAVKVVIDEDAPVRSDDAQRRKSTLSSSALGASDIDLAMSQRRASSVHVPEDEDDQQHHE